MSEPSAAGLLTLEMLQEAIERVRESSSLQPCSHVVHPREMALMRASRPGLVMCANCGQVIYFRQEQDPGTLIDD